MKKKKRDKRRGQIPKKNTRLLKEEMSERKDLGGAKVRKSGGKFRRHVQKTPPKKPVEIWSGQAARAQSAEGVVLQVSRGGQAVALAIFCHISLSLHPSRLLYASSSSSSCCCYLTPPFATAARVGAERTMACVVFVGIDYNSAGDRFS